MHFGLYEDPPYRLPAFTPDWKQESSGRATVILVKTAAGVQVMKDRSVALSPRQRSAFILFDGKRTLDAVLAATAAMGVTRADLDQLLAFGLLADPAERMSADTVPMGLTGSRPRTTRPALERYAEAYPIAVQLTSAAGSRGFHLGPAVEEAGNYEQLLALAPMIREAVGLEKYLPLALALHDA